MSSALPAWPEPLAAFLADHALPGEAVADAENYLEMLGEANQRMNLVGASTLGDFWLRHFLDSAQLLALAPQARSWADLGSGAGLPGVILAILLKHTPGARVHLVESVSKKCAFLEGTVRALNLPAQVACARAEDLALEVEVVTARACAPLPRLLGFAAGYLERGAKGLFLKGSEVDSEISEARKSWRFDLVIHPSLSDPRGRVLEIAELARVR